MSTLPIPTNDEMENFFDLLARMRTDSRLLASIIKNNWGINQPSGDSGWGVYDETGDEIASDDDLRAALHKAELVVQGGFEG